MWPGCIPIVHRDGTIRELGSCHRDFTSTVLAVYPLQSGSNVLQSRVSEDWGMVQWLEHWFGMNEVLGSLSTPRNMQGLWNESPRVGTVLASLFLL